jgi:hypothetical protein
MAKDTLGKPDLTLLPFEALAAIAEVRAFGVAKYGDKWSWMVQVDAEDFQAAAMRHLFKAGVDIEAADDESGLYHLAHAAASALMALQILVRESKNKNYINQEDIDTLSLFGK